MASLLASTGGPFGAYNVNPPPQGGQGAYGQVPGPINLPPSLYTQATNAVPGLNQNAATASSDVQSLLQGQVSPDTESYIDRLIAAKGVSSGVPGSPFNTADLVKSLGLTSEQLMTSGLGAYNSLLQSVGGLQENPALQADIAQSNALLGAAPNPQQSVEQMLATMERYFGQGEGPSGTGGYGSTNILGPKPVPSFGPQYTGGLNTPIGSPDLNQNTVLTGGPGFNTTSSPTAATDPFTQWVQQTFGNTQFGNPAASSTAASGGDMTIGTQPNDFGSMLSDALSGAGATTPGDFSSIYGDMLSGYTF